MASSATVLRTLNFTVAPFGARNVGQGILPLYESIMSVFPFIILRTFWIVRSKVSPSLRLTTSVGFTSVTVASSVRTRSLSVFQLEETCVVFVFLYFSHHRISGIILQCSRIIASCGLSVDVVVLRDGDMFVCDFCGTREQLAKIAGANRNKRSFCI